MEWLSQLPQGLSHEKGTAELTHIEIQHIQKQILTPNRVTIKSFIDKFLALSPSKVYVKSFFILEALIVLDGKIPVDLELLTSYLSTALEIPNQKWSLGIKDQSLCTRFYYPLRVLRKLIEILHESDSAKPQLLTLASFHAYPNSPWSCDTNSELVVRPIKAAGLLDTAIIDMIIEIKPRLLTITKTSSQQVSLPNSKLTPAGYASSKSAAHGGLKPRLGYSHITEASDEESSRRNWKSCNNVSTISSIWLLIQLTHGAWFESYWPVVTSFVLNLLDDYEVRFKALGAELLGLLIDKLDEINDKKGNLLLRTGLADVFLDSLKVCLSYLPESTPVDESRIILTEAYPSAFKLAHILSEAKGNRLEFFDLINGYIISSIDSCFDRYGNTSKHLILALLLEQFSSVVQHYIHEDILVSLNRCNFVVNQIIVNPHIIESDSGIDCVSKCLQIHEAILQAFENADDEGKKLLANFRFDFLAAWSVYTKRLIKLEKPVPTSILKNNISLLKSITDIKEDIEKIVEQNQELAEYFA